MQLLGIGFAKTNWNFLVKRLQKHLSHQLDSYLFNDARLSLGVEISNLEIIDVSEKIKKLKPDWVLVHADFFKNPEVCINLLERLKNKSDKKLNFAMVIENFQHNLTPFLKFMPVFELVNNMKFKISTPDLLMSKNIKSFPRIRIDVQFKTMDYINNSGELVRNSPAEISPNTLISLKRIERIKTNSEELSPGKWLKKILFDKKNVLHAEQAVGILCEEKGCYLFPGIPFNSIKKIEFKKILVEHLLILNDCTIKNPPFKRFLRNMASQYQYWLKENEELSLQKRESIHCFIKQSLIKDVLANVFNEIGQSNIKIITEINSTKKLLKNSVNWLRLDSFPEEDLSDREIDWSLDASQIISPLSEFVDLNEIKFSNKSVYAPIQKLEFEKLKKNLLKEEKIVQNKIGKAEIDQMLYSQERDILQKLESLNKMLIKCLSTSRMWDETIEKASEIKLSKALLFCEEEILAAELNFKLTEVKKKLWINPLKFQKPEDLIQLNSKMVYSYLKPKTIIITPEAKIHLKNICAKFNDELCKAEEVFNNQKIQIDNAKTDLSLIRKNKKHLALRWLSVSFGKLLYRDRYLFKTLSKKIA